MPLSRTHVLQAALGILDSYGLADLSMRRVAAALDVQPGALYHHVPDKQTLLSGVADAILDELEEPLGRWRPAIEEWAANLRGVLLAHRDSAELVSTVRGFRLGRRDLGRHPATLLAAGGLTPADAHTAASTLLHFILGHVAEEQARRDWERFGPKTGENVRGDEATFELGLALILDGIGTRLDGPQF